MTMGVPFCIVNVEKHKQRKEQVMSTNTSISQKVFRIHRVLVAGLMILLVIAVTTGFVWIQTDHVIAPPGLRLLDGLWRLFICRCPLLGGPIHLM